MAWQIGLSPLRRMPNKSCQSAGSDNGTMQMGSHYDDATSAENPVDCMAKKIISDPSREPLAIWSDAPCCRGCRKERFIFLIEAVQSKSWA